MVYCPNCGTPNDDSAKYCNECGGEIRFDGLSEPKREIRTTPVYTPPRSPPSSRYTPSRHYQKDEADTIAYCCAFCVPIAGVILWLIWKDERPQTANTMLILGIVGFIISFFGGLATG